MDRLGVFMKQLACEEFASQASDLLPGSQVS